MKVGDKVRTKHGTEVGTIVVVGPRAVWVKWDYEKDPIPYRRSALVKVADASKEA